MRLCITLVVVLGLATAATPDAAARPDAGTHRECRADHGARYCRGVELRHAARALRAREAAALRELEQPLPRRRPLGWHVGRLYRHVVWLRRDRLPELGELVAAATDEALAIRIAARRYGLSYWGLRRVGGCESTGDSSGHDLDRLATNGWYLGLFQLGPSVRESSLRGPWWNALQNALAAARTIVQDGDLHQWSCGWAYS